MTTENEISIERYWICPLYTFTYDSERVVLDSGIEILKAPKEFRVFYENRYKTPSAFGEISIPDFLYQLKCNEKVEKQENKLFTSGEEVVRSISLLINFIQACRINKKGMIFPGELMLWTHENNEWSSGMSVKTYLSSQSNLLNSSQINYTLKTADLDKINNLIKLLSQFFDLDKRTILNIALRRFNSAYDGNIDDRLIDLMIAFESLYLGDDKELTYKLALRTAFFLGINKKSIFKEMKDAYNLRGAIVHANEKINNKKLIDIIPKCEEYLRQSIIKFLILLSQGISLKEIRNKLDENIITNGRTLNKN